MKRVALILVVATIMSAVMLAMAAGPVLAGPISNTVNHAADDSQQLLNNGVDDLQDILAGVLSLL